MERIFNIVSSFMIALAMVVLAVTSEHGNTYILIGYYLTAVLNIVLAICYFTPRFSRKWKVWLTIIMVSVGLVSLIADFIFFRMSLAV